MADNLRNLMNQMNIDPTLFDEDELKLLEQGGYAASDSEEDSMRESGASIDRARQRVPARESAPSSSVQHIENHYRAIVSGLQGRNKILEQEVERVRAAAESEKRSLLTEHRRALEAAQTELRQLRARHVHVEGQFPMIREALGQVRDMLSGLVPESVYLRLRDVPERDLPASEWILVNVWELVYPFKKEGELQKREIFRLREELKQAIDKHNQTLGEVEHANRMLYDKDDDHKRHQLNYENARKSLEVELTRVHEELEILREKGTAYDELMRKYKQVEQEKFLLEEKIGFYDSEQGKEGKHVLSEIYKTTDDIRRKNELLSQDKEYLTKENIELLEKNKRLEDRIDKLENELIESKNQAQEYLFRLLNHKTETVADYERKVNQQINELREKHDFELKQSKENLIEIYEKQIRFLKDTKDEVEYKLDQAEAISREKEKAFNNLLIENRTLQNQVNSDLADLRIKLAIKSEELDRVNNILEETMQNLRATKHAHDMTHEQLNLLKGEYYKEQSNKTQEFAEMKAINAVMNERLRDYETMEKDIDEAVEGLAEDGAAGDPNNPYLLTINNAPTSTRRRVRQAMNLAQRLQAKQKECEKYFKLLRERDTELEDQKQQLNIAQDLLSKTNQPYSMLLAQIEDKEKEIMKFNKLIKNQQADYQLLKEEYANLKKQFDQSTQDIQKLLIRRANIMNIQNLLIKLAQSDSQEIKGNVRALIDEITDILHNKAMVQGAGSPAFRAGGVATSQVIPERDEAASVGESTGSRPTWYNKLKSKTKK